MGAFWLLEARHAASELPRDSDMPVVHMPDLDEVGAADDRFEAAVRLYAGYIAPYVLADRPIDAIMAPSDGDVPVIASACRILRKTPNEDIAIVGYDNYWVEAETASKDLTAPLDTVDGWLNRTRRSRRQSCSTEPS